MTWMPVAIVVSACDREANLLGGVARGAESPPVGEATRHKADVTNVTNMATVWAVGRRRGTPAHLETRPADGQATVCSYR